MGDAERNTKCYGSVVHCNESPAALCSTTFTNKNVQYVEGRRVTKVTKHDGNVTKREGSSSLDHR